MTDINEITGDKLQSKVGNPDAYDNGWDRIFNKPKGSPCAHSWVLGEPATEVKQEETNGCCGECH